MEYSQKEHHSDVVQLVAGISLFSLVLVSQFFIFPMSENISSRQIYFRRYYLILSSVFIIDLVSSIVILKNSLDYDKHKFLRRNVGILFGILFSHIFFIIPYIANRSYSITDLHWIVVLLALYKIINHVKIFSIFQVSYKSLKPLE